MRRRHDYYLTIPRLLVAGLVLIWVLAMLVAGATPAAPVPTSSDLLMRGTVVTMDDNHRVIRDGNVLVRDGRVRAIWSGESPVNIDIGRMRVVEAGPGGLIFPGLINLHDHPTFDFLSLWPAPSTHVQPDSGRPTGHEPYDYRYQWGALNVCQPCRSPEHERLITSPHTALVQQLGLEQELLLYSEMRAALGGETATQGGVNGRIVRDVDGTNFGRDDVESTVQRLVDDPSVPDLKAAIAAGTIRTWLVHLAEGVRDADRLVGDTFSTRREFLQLSGLDLVMPATVVVHGVALERHDFEQLAAAGAKLVWSPLSNLLLYGRTTNVYEAMEAGLTVSLGTDWTPSGSKTLLDELKIADITLRDPRLLGKSRPGDRDVASEAALDRALVDMVTRNPAKTLGWREVGSIAPGMRADLVLLRRAQTTPTGGMPDTPYRNLIDATQRDLRLVLVDGTPVAGDIDAMQAAGATDITPVRAARAYLKGVAFRQASAANLRPAQAEERLHAALAAFGGDSAARASGQPPISATFSYLREHWNDTNCNEITQAASCEALSQAEFRDQVLATHFHRTPDGRLNIERIELTPLFTHQDSFFATVLEGTRNRAGIPDDPSAPFKPYPSNVNQGQPPLGNPFDNFRDRWYARQP